MNIKDRKGKMIDGEFVKQDDLIACARCNNTLNDCECEYELSEG